MVTPAARREAVQLVQKVFAVSQRRACQGLAIERRRLNYQSRKNDAVLRERLRALAHERRRFGYRRLAIFLRREPTLTNILKQPFNDADEDNLDFTNIFDNKQEERFDFSTLFR